MMSVKKIIEKVKNKTITRHEVEKFLNDYYYKLGPRQRMKLKVLLMQIDGNRV